MHSKTEIERKLSALRNAREYLMDQADASGMSANISKAIKSIDSEIAILNKLNDARKVSLSSSFGHSLSFVQHHASRV